MAVDFGCGRSRRGTLWTGSGDGALSAGLFVGAGWRTDMSANAPSKTALSPNEATMIVFIPNYIERTTADFVR